MWAVAAGAEVGVVEHGVELGVVAVESSRSTARNNNWVACRRLWATDVSCEWSCSIQYRSSPTDLQNSTLQPPKPRSSRQADTWGSIGHAHQGNNIHNCKIRSLNDTEIMYSYDTEHQMGLYNWKSDGTSVKLYNNTEIQSQNHFCKVMTLKLVAKGFIHTENNDKYRSVILTLITPIL